MGKKKGGVGTKNGYRRVKASSLQGTTAKHLKNEILTLYFFKRAYILKCSGWVLCP